jgi:carbon monoxide dehydrogenase subunit G
MPHIERTVTVDKPLDQVWEFLTDFTTTEDWDPPTVTTTRLSGDGGVGTTYKNVSKILGHETEIEYTVVSVEPQQKFQLTGRTTAMHLLDTMTFENDGNRTTVTYRAEFEPQGAAKLIEPLMPLGLKKIGDDAEQSLQETLSRL